MNTPALPLVSVLIPMYNEERYIAGCLQSLAQQDYPLERMEVLVLDGESTDNSRAVVDEFARRSPLQVRLLGNPGRLSSRGLNLGLMEACGDIVCITSGHSRLEPSFLSQGVGLLAERGVECVCGPITSVGEGVMGRTIALAMSSPFGVGDAMFRYSQREQLVDAAAFGVYRREVFSEVGGFDGDMVNDADSDFHYRLTELGGRILQTPKLKAYYYVRSTLRSLFRQYANYGLNKLVVMRRYPHRVKARQLVPGLFVAGLLASGAGASVSRDARVIFTAIIGNYLMVSLATSAALASRAGWRYFPLLPLAFACLHVSYGLGLLKALFREGANS